MGLLDLLGLSALPPGLRGANLVLLSPAVLIKAKGFLRRLENKVGQLALGLTEKATYTGRLPAVVLPDSRDKTAKLIARMKPRRLILLGLPGDYAWLPQTMSCPVFWLNASDRAAGEAGCRVVAVTAPEHLDNVPNAQLTGDPLLDLNELPSAVPDQEFCDRFTEQRQGMRWLVYFAGTGEGEEEVAYPLFNRLIRRRMGFMLLAPRDPARCEAVYREAKKHRLPTTRHAGLTQPHVPIRSRVYFIEDPGKIAAFYACADFVIAGGSIHPAASSKPDLVAPMAYGKPVIVGPAHRDEPLLAAAVEHGVVRAARNEEELYVRAKWLIDETEQADAMARRARAWIEAQAGAPERVLAMIAYVRD
jgi:3-deoxy-D-manno-octulosonic-acid transferase